MSYILDALKRADAERERGAVPGLHTQTFPLDSATSRAMHRSIPWLGIGIGLAVALLAMMAWHLLGSEAPHEAAAPPLATPPAVAMAPPPSPAPPAPAPVATLPVAPPEVPVVVAESTPVKSAPVPVAAAKPKPTRASTPPTDATPASRVMTRSELPENIRRELPTLTIGGAIHSANPANRMLIINGQLFHEGDKLGADLTLEQIKLRAAVLKYKEVRYTVSF